MFIEVTRIDDGCRKLIRSSHILSITETTWAPYVLIENKFQIDESQRQPATKIEYRQQDFSYNLLVRESYDEVKQMLDASITQEIEIAKSFNNTPWSSLSEETREAFLDELKQAREGLESRLGDK